MKKMKRYDDGGYTGDDPIVKYRMGISDSAPESGESDTSMDREPNPTPEPKAEAPAPKKAAPKAAPKPAPKAEPKKEESKPAPTKQQKAGPTMMKGEKNTGVDLKKTLFGGSSESPRMKAAKRDKAMDASNYSMKKGGKVKKMAAGGTASSRADGIAQRGKTRGKYC